MVVCEGNQINGVVVLEDILKPGMEQRFERLRKMGLRTVMITGDNPLTAATIAKQAGVDDFVAQATPETKLEYLRKQQAEGKLVAMMGDGTNDAPALAQADVALAMNAGTQAAKEAGQHGRPRQRPDQVDRSRRDRQAALDDPRRTNDVLDRQRRGEVFRDHPGVVRRHAAVAEEDRHHVSALADLGHPVGGDLQRLDYPGPDPGRVARASNISRSGADACLRKNLLIWGLGGVILPFIGIKVIDLVIYPLMVAMHMT